MAQTTDGSARARTDRADDDEGMGLLEALSLLRAHLKLLIGIPILAGLVAAGLVMLASPTYTASTTFMPPQQPQSAGAVALASLGALAGLAGQSVRSPPDQYVSMLKSETIANRLIDRFKLRELYEAKFYEDARKGLMNRTSIQLGKRDGLITVEVDDGQPERAAAIANAYVDELQRFTANLALTEAKQRRVYFEKQLTEARDKLTAAQQALESSGFAEGALRAEPKTAGEVYARLRAEATATEIRLQSMRGSFKENALEVQQLQDTLTALRRQMARQEQTLAAQSSSPNYLGKYREFKYQETLFELLARQYESARADESRDGALIQVIDPATAPERRSKPRRTTTVLMAMAGALAATLVFIFLRHALRQSSRTPRPATAY